MTDNIAVNTQSSITITGGSSVIRSDPFRISGAPHDADIILITHEHYDHFSPEDIAKVRKPDTVFAAPGSMRDALEGAGISDAVFLSAGESVRLSGADISAVPAYNRMKPFHPRSKGWLGYIVTVNDTRIYIAGDTDATDEAKAVECDIAMVPIGGTYTMNAKEAAELINTIRPKAAIPIHYGSIVGRRTDGDSFRKLVTSGTEVVLKL